MIDQSTTQKHIYAVISAERAYPVEKNWKLKIHKWIAIHINTPNIPTDHKSDESGIFSKIIIAYGATDTNIPSTWVIINITRSMHTQLEQIFEQSMVRSILEKQTIRKKINAFSCFFFFFFFLFYLCWDEAWRAWGGGALCIEGLSLSNKNK